jgi:hypothetical protein
MVAADARTTITFSLSPGNDHDASHRRALLEELGPLLDGLPLLMDHALLRFKPGNWHSSENDTGGSSQVQPTASVELRSRDLQETQRNRALFRRLKGSRRIFSLRKTRCALPGIPLFRAHVEALRVV